MGRNGWCENVTMLDLKWRFYVQVFVPNSYKNSDVGHPFGYLKASTNLTCVNLFVMPYNYPALLPLLDELFKVHRSKPTPEWRAQFQNYLRTMPAYYAQVRLDYQELHRVSELPVTNNFSWFPASKESSDANGFPGKPPPNPRSWESGQFAQLQCTKLHQETKKPS